MGSPKEPRLCGVLADSTFPFPTLPHLNTIFAQTQLFSSVIFALGSTCWDSPRVVCDSCGSQRGHKMSKWE